MKPKISYKSAAHKQQTGLKAYQTPKPTNNQQTNLTEQINPIKQLTFEEFKARYEPDEYNNEELQILYQKAIKRRR